MKNKIKDKKSGKFIISVKIILLVVVTLLVLLFFIRLFSARHLDDVHPNIPCEDDLLEKADNFYVIPKFDGVNISDYSQWCAKIKSYNKTIALHGVYHTYHEFLTSRDSGYVDSGAIEFEKCFGFYPDRFKAPQLELSGDNKKLLLNEGYNVDSKFENIFHKAYHCNEEGLFPNWIHDLI